MAGSHARSDRSGETMDTQQPTIGVLGLGAMGAPMTRRLLEAGKHVVISSRREKPDLVAAGATWAATPREVGAAADAESEEHTSELQSRGHLVCRLLLEQK